MRKTLSALAIVTFAVAPVSLIPVAALADAKPAHAHNHSHGDDKGIAKGYFDDSQIAPRELSDWAGEWQSVYPLLVDGTLDEVMAHKAEHGDKTAAEYKTYYDAGYKTDIGRITIDGSKISFQRDGQAATGEYAADGHEVLTYKKGNRGVRFIFRKVSGDEAAPAFIQFSDHRISPEKADHFHLYMGDDRAKLLEELTNWPTYYPAALTPAQIVDEMNAH